MKRFFALLMAVCVGVLCSTTAMAQTKDILTVSGPASCSPGSNITLSFGLASGSYVETLDVNVEYDDSVFTLVGYQNGSVTEGALSAENATIAGEFKFILASIDPISSGGPLFTLTFRADSSASIKNYDFFFYSNSCSISGGTDITTYTKKHTLSVKRPTASTPSSSVPASRPNSSTSSRPVVSTPSNSSPQSNISSSTPVTSNPGVSTPSGNVDSSQIVAGTVDIGVVSSTPQNTASNHQVNSNDVSAKPQDNQTIGGQGPKVGSLSLSWIVIVSVALGATLLIVGVVLLLLAIVMLKAKKAKAEPSVDLEKDSSEKKKDKENKE